MIPLLGQFAVSLLHPVLAGGIMLGCRAQDRGGHAHGRTICSPASPTKLAPLVIVGAPLPRRLARDRRRRGRVSYSTVVGGGALAAIASGDAMQTGYALLTHDGHRRAGRRCSSRTADRVPLLMAYWFAPALVVLRNDEPVAAMKTSFRACLANMLPMLVYGIARPRVRDRRDAFRSCLGWLVLVPGRARRASTRATRTSSDGWRTALR